MTAPKTFKHTDGRTFIHLGEVPYTTRDRREIKLQRWQTTCFEEGCLDHIEVRTATYMPENWRNFEPKKYCVRHLISAKQKAVKARAEGHARWLLTDEGKASMQRRKGPVTSAVLAAVESLQMVDSTVKIADVYALVTPCMDPPTEDKRDTRPYRIKRAIETLIAKDQLHVAMGSLQIGPRPK